MGDINRRITVLRLSQATIQSPIGKAIKVKKGWGQGSSDTVSA
jgi:hypothetical protein